MKKFLLLTILLPTLVVLTVVLILGYFYWYLPYSQDQALREEWRQEEDTAKRLEILEEYEQKLKVAKTKQEKFEALVEIGFSRYVLEDYIGAVKYWQKTLELDPANSLVWYNLGNAYENLEENTQAEECFKKAINTDPGTTPIFYKALADLYWYKIPEKKEDIVSIYTLGLLKGPPKLEKIELLGNLGFYYESVGNKEMAYKQYLKILNLDPTNKFAIKRIDELWKEE